MDIKKCDECKRELVTSEFETYKSGTLRNVCKACHTLKNNLRNSQSPKKFLNHLHAHLKYAREKTMDWDLAQEDLHDIWDSQQGQCAVTGVYMTWKKGGGSSFNVSIDRIIADGPYIKTNIQLVCYRINMMKHRMSENDFYWWCKNVVVTKETFKKEE